MTKNEIAVVQNYNLQTVSTDFAQAAEEELDGLGALSFDKVKIPSGGQTAFEVPGETEGETEIAKSIVGVIVHHHPVNAYWADPYSGGNNPPDCTSFDGKTGVEIATGEVHDCASCQYNQFGSDVNKRGKACKNIHRCYIMQEGNPVPLILSLPPTSLKGLRDYIGKKLLLRGMRTHAVVTEISLKKEAGNGTVPAYSKAVFSLNGKLSEEQAKDVEGMRNLIRATTNKPDISNDDYNMVGGAVDSSEFQTVENQDNIPFR